MAHEAVIVAYERRQFRYGDSPQAHEGMPPGERNSGPLSTRDIMDSRFKLHLSEQPAPQKKS